MSSLAVSARDADVPATASASREAPIDRAHLRRFTLGDTALEHEVLGLFAEQAPTYLLQLMAADDGRAWFEAAHALKGSARAVGAWQVEREAERAEAMKPGADADARAGVIEALSETLEETRQYIAALP